MTEPLSNMGYVCHVHSPQPNNQEFTGKSPEWFVNKFCKLMFPTSPKPRYAPKWVRTAWPTIERMWVKVICVQDSDDDHVLCGVLNNEPKFCLDLKCGDYFEFRLDEIVEVLPEE